MRNDPMFNITFVKCIERYPCLWNHTMKEYSRRNITDSAWNEVAKELKESESNCRERWKNIRAAFVRSRRPTITDSGVKHKKTYYLNKHLQFLIPYTKSHPGTLTYRDEYDVFEIEETDPLEESAKPLISEIDIEENSNVDNNVTYKTIKPTSSKQDYNYLAHENATNSGFTEWTNTEESNSQADDPDLHFFQSLLPDVRQLSDKKKRNFKKAVIDILDKLLDDDDDNNKYIM